MFEIREAQGPSHPKHVIVDVVGIPYVKDVEIEEDPLPERFLGAARPDDVSGPPWPTLIFGLETGRDAMRERFLAALAADVAAGHPLERYGDALESAFRHTFGGRGATTDAPGFLEFLDDALRRIGHPGARVQLERGIRQLVPRGPDPRIAGVGASAVVFPLETGHSPPDHRELLYWLTALVPDWTTIHFDQNDQDGDRLAVEAWWAGRRFRAPAENVDDWMDAWSCAGLVNVILRDGMRSALRVALSIEDETGLAVAGTRSTLRALRAQGVLGDGEDDEA